MLGEEEIVADAAHNPLLQDALAFVPAPVTGLFGADNNPAGKGTTKRALIASLHVLPTDLRPKISEALRACTVADVPVYRQ